MDRRLEDTELGREILDKIKIEEHNKNIRSTKPDGTDWTWDDLTPEEKQEFHERNQQDKEKLKQEESEENKRLEEWYNKPGEERRQIEKKQEEERQKKETYHDIARRLADKQGFLFSARELIKDQPIHYDKNKIWWVWNKNATRWELTDETEILNIVTTALRIYNIGDASVKSKTNMIEALRQEGRLNKPKPFPKHWVQFKDQIFDLQSKQIFPATSEYFSINPLPWTIGLDTNTPTISKLFDEWVGPEHSESLYEILAYICYTDYPIHTVFCLNGIGRNGKSKFQGLIQRFIGQENLCSSELDTLTEKSNRFSTFNLYKKLCCLMGETNFNLITNSTLLKKLTGQDLIAFEKKGADVFNDYNYAKIIINTNSLPPSADQSDGFYRRWMIIDFPNQFTEGKDILDEIPEYEYRNLAKKITIILPQLLERHSIIGQGTIEERRQRYIERSNPLLHFIEEFYVTDPQATEKFGSLYTHYASWLKKTNRRVPSTKMFTKLLNTEGYELQNTSLKAENGGYDKCIFVFGLRLKEKLTDYENKGEKGYTGITGITGELSTHPLRVESSRDIARNARNASIGAINAVYKSLIGTDIGKEIDSFISKTSVLENIRVLGTPTYEELLSLFPGMDVEVMQWVQELKTSGDIFLIPGGRLKILE